MIYFLMTALIIALGAVIYYTLKPSETEEDENVVTIDFPVAIPSPKSVRGKSGKTYRVEPKTHNMSGSGNRRAMGDYYFYDEDDNLINDLTLMYVLHEMLDSDDSFDDSGWVEHEVIYEENQEEVVEDMESDIQTTPVTEIDSVIEEAVVEEVYEAPAYVAPEPVITTSLDTTDVYETDNSSSSYDDEESKSSYDSGSYDSGSYDSGSSDSGGGSDD